MTLRPGLALLLLAALSSAARPCAAADLRLVSFNAAMGLGAKLWSRASLERLFTKHAQLRGAQVLTLQELCLNRPAQLAAFLRVIEQHHGVQYHFSDTASTRRGEDCDKGQAIVSAFPILAAGTLRLPRVGASRVALFVDLAVPGPGFQRMRIYNLHLSNRRHTNYVPQHSRREQARPVLESALSFMREHPGLPVVVAGDFNSLGSLTEPSHREPVIQSFMEYFQPSQPEFQATFLLPYQLDWVFSANLRQRQSQVVSLLYSDHLPVVVDYDF